MKRKKTATKIGKHLEKKLTNTRINVNKNRTLNANVEFDKYPQKWSHKWNVTLIFLFLEFAFDCMWAKQTKYVRRCEDIVSQFGYVFDWFLSLFHFEYVKMINLWHNFKINRSEKTIIIAT